VTITEFPKEALALLSLLPVRAGTITPKIVIGFDLRRSKPGGTGNRADLFGEAAHTGCMVPGEYLGGRLDAVRE